MRENWKDLKVLNEGELEGEGANKTLRICRGTGQREREREREEVKAMGLESWLAASKQWRDWEEEVGKIGGSVPKRSKPDISREATNSILSPQISVSIPA